MQASGEEMQKNPDQVSDSETEMSQELFRFLNFRIRSKDDDVNPVETESIAEEEEEEEFSFMCGEASTSPIAAEDAFINGQIKPFFPLFNRDLLLSAEDLPMKPSVDKVFVETPEQNIRVTSSDDEIVGSYCEWTSGKAVEVGSPEMCKKSNSTGFSKIWRFKEFMGRSNSDGRDAFVFLNNGYAPPRAPEKAKRTSKGKTGSISAHEVYLRSKAKEEGRRRASSYLPYRPELMGFFTNAKGGLTKNVHPF